MQGFITSTDYVLLPFFYFVLYIIARTFRERHYPVGHPWRKYFMPAFQCRIAGSIMISMVYQYYYGGGDTANYYYHARVVNSALSDSLTMWLNLVLHIPPWYSGEYALYIHRLYWYRTTSEFMVVSITSVIGAFDFTTFLPTAIIFGAISFTGVWALFRTFATRYPAYTKYIAISALFIPSTIMWGSGVFKDTVCLGCLGWLTYCSFQLLLNRNFSLMNFVFLGISFYLIAVIKVYILLAFMPALVLWVLFTYLHRIQNPGARFFVKIFVLSAFVVGVGVSLLKLGSVLGKYSIANIAETASVTGDFINSQSGDQGSSYDLGDLDPTPAGMAKQFFPAINVTLFRPYIWETRKPMQFLNAIEASLFLWLTIKILVTVGLRQTWRTIKHDPTLQFFLIFTIIFAFAVGMTSGNFGTLSRYRIPCLPFYAMSLFVIYYKNKPADDNIFALTLRKNRGQ